MKRPMFIVVPDKAGQEWVFPFSGDTDNLEEWRYAGLKVELIEASIPAWAAGTPAAWIISKLQQAWRWARLW